MKKSEAWLIFCTASIMISGFIILMTGLICWTTSTEQEQHCSGLGFILFIIGNVLLELPMVIMLLLAIPSFCKCLWYELLQYMC